MLHLLPSTPEDCQFFWHETDCSVNGNRFVRIKQPIYNINKVPLLLQNLKIDTDIKLKFDYFHTIELTL